MSAVVGLLAAGAVLAVRGPRGRPVAAMTAHGGATGRPGVDPGARTDAQVGARTGRGIGGQLVGLVTGRTDDPPEPVLVEVLAMVGASLRAGRTPAEAWRATGVVTGPDGVPGPSALLAVATRTSGARTRRPPVGRGDRHLRHAVAVHAAARLAARLGAPLAPVLERVADAIATDDEVEAERRAVLAGPRSTATVLGWLPVLGLLLGYGLGADPLGVVLDGGVGALSALLGAVLLVAGRWWTARMLAGARAAGAVP